jgi:hypothetical protein
LRKITVGQQDELSRCSISKSTKLPTFNNLNLQGSTKKAYKLNKSERVKVFLLETSKKMNLLTTLVSILHPYYPGVKQITLEALDVSRIWNAIAISNHQSDYILDYTIMLPTTGSYHPQFIPKLES